MARPGVMLYFDLLEPLKMLSYEDKGKLLDAMLEYGQYGVIPKLDGMAAMAWGFIRPSLDRDAEAYQKKVLRNTYNSYCAKCKREKTEPLEFEEWQTDRDQSTSGDTERCPTTTAISTPDTKTTPKGTRASVGDREGAGGEEPLRGFDYRNADMAFNNKRNAAIESLINYGK